MRDETKCPQCGKPLERITYPGGYLNRDQWESVRAGDWWCETCPSNGRGRSGAYFWNREVATPLAPSEAGGREEVEQARAAALDYLDVAADAQREVDLTFDALAPLGTEFLDPPDGGDVPLHEQARRVVRALADARLALSDERRARLASRSSGDGARLREAATEWLAAHDATVAWFNDQRPTDNAEGYALSQRLEAAKAGVRAALAARAAEGADNA